MMSPACAWVFALNCLQKSMMLTPCCPSAGPTGGAGFALPAGICSFTYALMVFAMIRPSPLQDPLEGLHLEEIELDRSRAAENAHHHLDLAALEVHLVDLTGEIRERTVDDLDVLADAERHRRDGLRLGGLHLAEDPPNLVLLEGRRRGAGADEARHARHVLHQVARIRVHLHLCLLY